MEGRFHASSENAVWEKSVRINVLPNDANWMRISLKTAEWMRSGTEHGRQEPKREEMILKQDWGFFKSETNSIDPAEAGDDRKMNIQRSVRDFLWNVLRTYIPMNCPVCGGVPADGRPNMFCADCLSKMPFIRKPSCRMCGGELDGFLDICSECCRKSSLRPWTEARAVFRMEGELQEMIHAFKYQNHPELARTFGYFACDAVSGILNSVDVIVPIPLHWTRQWKRGYNQ